MQVTYLEHMGSDLTVVNCARASYGASVSEITDKERSLILYLARGYTSGDWSGLHEKIKYAVLEGDDELLHDLLWQVKNVATHWAPFSHPQISFRVTAPLYIARQLWKSHIGAVGGDCGYAAWSEESRRYRDSAPNYYVPSIWRGKATSNKQGSSGEVDYDSSKVTALLDQSTEVYLDMLAHNVAPEQARGVLTNSLEVTWTWTGSLAFFYRVFGLRSDSHAQAENQEIIIPFDAKLSELFPVSWQALRFGRL